MIIEFSVKNFRSIKSLQTLSMIAAPIKSKNPELDTNNIITVSEKLTLLKSAAIYGANGSGKSNLVRAMIGMMVFVRDSFKDEEVGKRIIEPFALDARSHKEPTLFQLVFILGKVKYRYGFEVFKNQVKSEWLFGTPGGKEVYYFTRTGKEFQINENKFAEGKGLKDKTSETNLFLNICKAFNGKVSKSILDFFAVKIAISYGVNDKGFRDATLHLMKNKKEQERILALLNMADFGMDNIGQKKITRSDLPENTPTELLKDADEGKLEFVLSERTFFDDNGNSLGTREFLLDEQESHGTQKFFNYSGAIIDAINDGGALILDEFDARLHPALTKKIVEIFNSSTINKNKAQLIFVTHDTNLLDNKLLRRDQIFFAEKNQRSETELYTLVDFKGVRNDASYEKDYIKGKYGAIPFLGNFEKLFD